MLGRSLSQRDEVAEKEYHGNVHGTHIYIHSGVCKSRMQYDQEHNNDESSEGPHNVLDLETVPCSMLGPSRRIPVGHGMYIMTH